MALAKGSGSFAESGNVVAILFFYHWTRFVEIDGSILAVLVGAGRDARHILRDRSFHWPNERMNRAEDEYRRLFVPTGVPERFPSVGECMRFKGPGGVRAELGGNPQLAQEVLRLGIARDHQRFVNVSFAHVLNQGIHVASFAAIGERKFVFRGGQAQRADQHGRERIRELALEHRAFARNHAVTLLDFTEQERRENVRQIDLPRALEIAGGAAEVLRHYTEVDMARAKDVPHLAEPFLYANIRPGVARAVVAGKHQAECFAGSPALAETKHPAEAANLDQGAYPRDEEKIGHA